MAKTPDPTKDKDFNEALRRALEAPPLKHADEKHPRKKPPKKKAAKRKANKKGPG
jgi:hypothetical protein